MDLQKSNQNKITYVVVFFVLNLINTFLLTSNLILENLDPFPRTVFMIINSFFGDFGFFLLFLGLAIVIFKTDYARARFLMILSIVFGVIYFGLSIYFQHYNMFFSIYNLSAFSADGGGDAAKFVVDSLLLLLTSAEFIFLLSAVIIILLYIFLFRKLRKNIVFKNSSIITGKNRIIIGFGVFIIGILIMANCLSAFRVEIEDTWHEDNSTPLYGTQTVGLFNYYIYEAFTYFTKSEFNPDKIKTVKEKLKELENNTQISPIDGKEYPLSDYHGLYKDKNLLLIQLESLNNFVIGLQLNIDGKMVEITPNLNRIASESLYFSNYYTGVGIGNTSDSEFTTLTGLYPIGNNYIIYDYDEVKYQTLPDLFKQEGYYTYSSHANTGIFYERTRVHTTVYGFNKHYGKEELNVTNDKLIHTWLNDYDFLMQNIDIFANEAQNSQVFSFLITVTAHMPYSRPSETTGTNWFNGKDNIFPEGFKIVENTMLNQQIIGYLEHVAFTDYAIGKAIESLEAKGLKDNTIIALYGDHGCDIDIFEMFYESSDLVYNYINPMIEYLPDSNQRVLQNRRFMANIPFMIYEPSDNKVIEPRKIELVRGTSSTARTLANLFDLNAKYYFGVDALSDVKTYAYNPRNLDIYIDGGIISGQSKHYAIIDNDEYNDNLINKIIKSFYDYKDFNDKLIKYKIFPPLN